MDKAARSLKRVIAQSTSQLNSKAIVFESNKLAKFADGSATCTLGDTSVLVTAVCEPAGKRDDQNFTALTVDYKQKAAAAGRIPTNHLRREIGVTDREIIVSRMIDRSLRPCFPKGFNQSPQIICNLLAIDGQNDPEVLAINGASASLTLSDIPWSGPIGATRVGILGDKVIPNPTRHELENSRINLILAANAIGNVLMLDGHCREPVLIPDINKAIKTGLKECQNIIKAISELATYLGKPKRQLDTSHLPSDEEIIMISEISKAKISEILKNHSYDKVERGKAVDQLKREITEQVQAQENHILANKIDRIFVSLLKQTYFELLRDTGYRCDGRKVEDVRDISCSVDLYKPLHGSALFQRGQTQVFCSTTFDSPDSAFRLDPVTAIASGLKEKNFMLHYEFPPYATNENKRNVIGRRDIGHGTLAENAIRPLVPHNPSMTTRLNCEVLESSGSSSMASVCAGSMSLMDAGVKLTEHVAGVAMGLFSDPSYVSEDGNETEDELILTDILGFEDFFGDMDFKIAGTKKGITAMQLDVKLQQGLKMKSLTTALARAHKARSSIINVMKDCIEKPREERKDNHPVIKYMEVPIQYRSKLIGYNGSNMKTLMAKTGVRLSFCFPDDTSTVDRTLTSTPASESLMIFAPNQDAMSEAEVFINDILDQAKEPELEFNGIYTARITEIRSNGVMVTLFTNMRPTLLPLSQLDIKSVQHPEALGLEVGQHIQVKYFGRDPANGQMRLSRKSLQMTSAPRRGKQNLHDDQKDPRVKI